MWSEPDPVALAYVRFLAGYPRAWLFKPDLVDAVDAAVVSGMTLGEAERALVGVQDPRTTRPVLLHLLGRLRTDLSAPLSSLHLLKRAA